MSVPTLSPEHLKLAQEALDLQNEAVRMLKKSSDMWYDLHKKLVNTDYRNGMIITIDKGILIANHMFTISTLADMNRLAPHWLGVTPAEDIDMHKSYEMFPKR